MRVSPSYDRDSIGRTGVLGHLKGDFDVALCTEVVDFGGAHLGKDVDEIGAVAQVAIVELELVGTCECMIKVGQVRLWK